MILHKARPQATEKCYQFIHAAREYHRALDFAQRHPGDQNWHMSGIGKPLLWKRERKEQEEAKTEEKKTGGD